MENNKDKFPKLDEKSRADLLFWMHFAEASLMCELLVTVFLVDCCSVKKLTTAWEPWLKRANAFSEVIFVQTLPRRSLLLFSPGLVHLMPMFHAVSGSVLTDDGTSKFEASFSRGLKIDLAYVERRLSENDGKSLMKEGFGAADVGFI